MNVRQDADEPQGHRAGDDADVDEVTAIHAYWRCDWWPLAMGLAEQGYDVRVYDGDVEPTELWDGDVLHGVIRVWYAPDAEWRLETSAASFVEPQG